MRRECHCVLAVADRELNLTSSNKFSVPAVKPASTDGKIFIIHQQSPATPSSNASNERRSGLRVMRDRDDDDEMMDDDDDADDDVTRKFFPS